MQVADFKTYSISVLKKHGARMTKARLAVIECLEQAQEPLTAREILDHVERNRSAANIDPVTAYRILERFEEYGLVHQIAPSGRYLPCTHLRCAQNYHVLLHCSHCQKVQEEHIPTEVISSFFWYLKNTLAFKAERHVFQMDGVCRQCQMKSERAQK